jgi:cyclomaltodextrinase
MIHIEKIFRASPCGSGHPWLRFAAVLRTPSLWSGPLLPLTLQWLPRKCRATIGVMALFAIFLISCQSRIELPHSSQSLITGLATPVLLSPDTTLFFILDYIDEIAEIEEIIPPAGLTIKPADGPEELYLIASEELQPLSYLTILDKSGQEYHIVLKKSDKQIITYQFDPGDRIYGQVSLVGDINAWNPDNTPLTLTAGKWSAQLILSPGIYGYQIVTDGEWQLDPAAENMDNGIGGRNSILKIEGPDAEELPYAFTFATDEHQFTLDNSGAAGKVMVLWENYVIADTLLDPSITIKIPGSASKHERSHIRILAYNDKGIGNDLFIPLQFGSIITDALQLTRSDLHTQMMYFLMVDRFYNGNKDNDRPEDDPLIHPLANFMGGDLEGVLQQLDRGYFDSLGVNTVWLSPVSQNPQGAYGLWDKGGVKSTFSAYHGYWPTGLSVVDPRFGGDESLHDLIRKLHAKEKNILLDFVAHHIHESHPLYAAKKDQNWFTSLYLPDGSLNTERWDDHRLTTWFDVFLPTFNFFNPEVNDMLSDTAMHWLHTFEVDGFRHDATKHVHLDFWRTLTRKVKSYKKNTGKPVYQVGETYGTPELIASYINTGMLDAQFDFNLFDAAITTICKEESTFDDLAQRLSQSLRYYGYNHLMGNMSGNQDRARFMAYATGDIRFDEDAKLAGWTRDIEKRTKEGFDKLALMHAFNLSIPGVPCLYYGDELGMTGGNDPDNRRMMYFEGWTAEEQQLFSKVKRLHQWRRNFMPLLYGDLKIHRADGAAFVFSRNYFGQQAIVVLNKSAEFIEVTLPLRKNLQINKKQSFSGNTITEAHTVTIAPLSFDIIVLQ